MLGDMRVVSFCHYLQGPAATQYLADMGAEVVKIEPPEGAFERQWSGANTCVGGVSAFYLCANRNKRSIAIDLKHPGAHEVVTRLIERADVVVENFRPGVMDRLGLGYDQVRARKPDIIYASSTGFGSSGPDSAQPGQDLLVQARSGLHGATRPPATRATPGRAPRSLCMATGPRAPSRGAESMPHGSGPAKPESPGGEPRQRLIRQYFYGVHRPKFDRYANYDSIRHNLKTAPDDDAVSPRNLLCRLHMSNYTFAS